MAFISTRVRANSRPARPDPWHQPPDDGAKPVRHAAQREAARCAFHIGHEPLHCIVPLAGAAGGLGVDLSVKQLEKFRTAVVAHQQPLLALSAHVAHGDVGQHIGVVDAGPAGEREEIARQFRDRQLQEGDLAHPPVAEAQLHVIVGTELEIGDGVGRFRRAARGIRESAPSWCCRNRACRSRRGVRGQAHLRARAGHRPDRECRSPRGAGSLPPWPAPAERAAAHSPSACRGSAAGLRRG